MQTVLIAGGAGLIGTALSRLLISRGYRVTILTRRKKWTENKQLPGPRPAAVSSLYKTNEGTPPSGVTKRSSLPEYALWDPAKGTIDREVIEQADYIVHLAGAGVADKRWNTARKKEILDSRVRSSALLVKALTEIPNNVKAVIAASAIGWYGPDPVVPNPHPFVETDPASPGFLGETCLKWEQSIDPVSGLNKRLVKFRTGLLLSREGGAFPEFRRPASLGIAAILGNGSQVVSWIHIDDLCNLYLKAIENDHLNGVYNAIAPAPVSNKALTLRLARSVKGSFYIPLYVPAFIIKAMLGEMSIEVLKSTTVSADKIRSTGFKFIYPTIDAAIGALTDPG